MASRDFDSEYVNLLAEAALIGLKNHIDNEWKDRCRRQYKWLMENSRSFWARFWARFWNGGEKIEPWSGTFEEFVEARKQWLYYEAKTYTLWDDHVEGWLNVGSLIRRLKQLSENNANGGIVIRLDDSEFNTLRKYAKVELI